MMAEIHDFPTDEAIRAAAQRLKSGGGGGTSDGMEQRVKSLEDNMTEVRIALARIEAKLDSKVDYKWLTFYVLGIVAVIMRNEIAAFLTAG